MKKVGLPTPEPGLYIRRVRAYGPRHLTQLSDGPVRIRSGTADPAGGEPFPDRPIAGTPKDMK